MFMQKLKSSLKEVAF